MKVQRSERGQTTIFIAVFMAIVFLGMAALAIDVGFLYHQRRMVQTAADAGALAAATAESASGATSASVLAAATAAATANGLTVVTVTPAAGQANVTQSNAPLTSGTTAYVQVTVTEAVQPYILRAFRSGFSLINVSASAQASYTASNQDCATALSGTGVSTGAAPLYASWGNASFGIAGGASLKAPNCKVCANGTYNGTSTPPYTPVFMSGGASVTTLGVVSPGGDVVTGGASVTSTDGTSTAAGSCSNPFAGILPVPSPGACNDPSWMSGNASGTAAVASGKGAGGGTESLSAGTYCNFNTANVGTLNLSPGTYYIEGSFQTNSGTTVNGTGGVTFVFINSTINGTAITTDLNQSDQSPYTYSPLGMANGASLNITAPTSGSYAGVAFYDYNTTTTQDTVTFGEGASSTINGAIYMPNSNLVLNDGSATGVLNSDIIANTIRIAGGTVDLTYSGGTPAPGSVNLVQ
jgi:Flp pilus assembly protein TadG